MKEDVLESRAADEHAVWLETELVDVRRGGIAVVRIEQQPVRKCLEPADQAVQARRELGSDFLRAVFSGESEARPLRESNNGG